MIDLGSQKWLGDERLAKLFSIIEKVGGQARIAGGAVRNGLWGIGVNDIDVATTLVPQKIVEVCKANKVAVYPTGIDHGTVTVVIDHLSIEVTTLRADVETDGRHAKVAFTTDWAVDAQRRDFTFNALYCDLDGKVFDETGQGLADHKMHKVRFVGDARQRISEDYLRILRYFRFEAQHGNGIFDEISLAACVEMQAGLKELSRERVQVELFKTLVAPRAALIVEELLDNGILQRLISVSGTVGLLKHLIVIEAVVGLNPDPLLRLAMLCDDVSTLRLSRKQMERFERLKTGTNICLDNDELKHQALLYKIGPVLYQDAVIMEWVSSRNFEEKIAWKKLFQLPERWIVPEFPLTGKDLMSIGFEPGKLLGDTLKLIERNWVTTGFSMKKPALLKKATMQKK